MHALAGVNILLGLVGFSWLLIRTTARLHEYPPEVLNLLYLAMALFFGLLVTSMEMFYRNDTSYTALAITLVKVYALYVLWRHRATLFRTGQRTKTASDSRRVDKDIF